MPENEEPSNCDVECQAEKPRLVSREIYYSLLVLADDGCPLVNDLEEYVIVDKDFRLSASFR